MPLVLVLVGLALMASGNEDLGFIILAIGAVTGLATVASSLELETNTRSVSNCPPHSWSTDINKQLYCKKCMSRPGT